MTNDLIAFITARLDEDEAAAKAAQESAPSDGELAQQAGPCVDEAGYVHIARHDPARVLREVAAKRARLDRHHPIKDPAVIRLYGTLCAWCSSLSVGARQRWPRPDVLDDLAVWNDHPDYIAEWKP